MMTMMMIMIMDNMVMKHSIMAMNQTSQPDRRARCLLLTFKFEHVCNSIYSIVQLKTCIMAFQIRFGEKCIHCTQLYLNNLYVKLIY
jgi:hypothetical protein